MERILTNEDIFNKLGLKLSGDKQKDDFLVNTFFKTGSQNKITIYLNNGKQKVNLTPANHNLAFFNEVWEKLSLSEKLIILKWKQTEYLTLKGYKGEIPKFKFFKNLSGINYSAFADVDGLCVDLKRVNEFSGLDALAVIIHECEHHLDFEKANEIISKFSGVYLKNTNDVNKLSIEVMQLPIEGKKLKNLKTGEFDFITDELANEILLLKNYFITINPEAQTPKRKKHIQSVEAFEKYIKSMVYYNSPLEVNAYKKSIQYVGLASKIKTKCILLNEKDIEVLKKLQNQLKNLEGKKREIQKYYKISRTRAINMELVHKFNSSFYGKNKDKYLLPELMQQREEILKDLWNKSLGYYGNFEQAR